MRRFATITDVTDALYDLEPEFVELTEEQMRDVVRANHSGRYEDITEAEFEAMLVAAYVATGADQATARALASR